MAGAALRDELVDLLPDTPMTVLETGDDVLLCYEAAQLPLLQIARALSGTDPTSADLARQVLCRQDIRWTPLDPERIED